MLSIRASSLDTYANCQRLFAAKWLIEANHELALTYQLRTLRPNIGAIVGTGSHSGVAYLLEEFKRTGEHGGQTRVRSAKEVATEEIRTLSERPITTDPTTPNAIIGMAAASKIVQRYHHDVRHDHEPLLIEKGLKVKAYTNHHEQFQITSTMDAYIINAVLEDLKTGVRLPKPAAQIGQYSINAKANGLPVDTAKIRFAERMRPRSTQPPIMTFDMPIEACEQHAARIAKQAAGRLMKMMATSDPSPFIPNPGNFLCDEKYCPAHGTPFCHVGNMIDK